MSGPWTEVAPHKWQNSEGRVLPMIRYASGHLALSNNDPATRIELWKPWPIDPSIWLPISSPLF